MNWLDYVFIGIIGLSVIISLFRGLTKEVLSLLIWVAAFWVAYNYVDVGAVALDGYIELPSARHLIAFVGLFILALIIGGMINFIIGKLISKTGLSGTDRFLGMFFGALRGLIVIVAMTFFIKATPLSEDSWWQDSTLSPHFSKMSEWVRGKMPEEFSNYFSFIENNKENDMDKLLEKLAADKLLDNTDEKTSDETLENTPENKPQEQQ